MKKLNSTLSIIIPAWNSEKLLRKNLPFVFKAAAQSSADIIVVDDHSTKDNTYNLLKSYNKKITLLRNDKTIGFAKSVNIGVSASKADFVALLNTDVVPSVDCFDKALKEFDDDTFAITLNSDNSCAVASWNDGILEHFRVNIEENVSKHPSLWASGGQGVFNREKWLLLDGMDPLYQPFYWEDTDLGFRAWKRGWKIYWLKTARVVHEHDESVIASNFTSTFIKQIALRNQILFIWKNITDSKLLYSHLLRLPQLVFRYPRSFFSALIRLPRALASRPNIKKTSKLSDQEILSIWE